MSNGSQLSLSLLFSQFPDGMKVIGEGHLAGRWPGPVLAVLIQSNSMRDCTGTKVPALYTVQYLFVSGIDYDP